MTPSQLAQVEQALHSAAEYMGTNAPTDRWGTVDKQINQERREALGAINAALSIIREATPQPAQQQQQQELDAKRFAWYFADSDKSGFLSAYIAGVSAGWTIDQWRAAIDAAMDSGKSDTGSPHD